MANGTCKQEPEQVRSEQGSYVGKSARQKGQQGQAPDADVILARLRKECQCVRRGARKRESHQGYHYKLICAARLLCVV